MFQHGASLKHSQLRIGCCARSRAKNRNILTTACIDQLHIKLWLFFIEFLTFRHQVSMTHQARIVIFAHATWVAIDYVFNTGTFLSNLKDLVDLFFIFGNDDFRTGIVNQISNFLVKRILIDTKDHCPQRM